MHTVGEIRLLRSVPPHPPVRRARARDIVYPPTLPYVLRAALIPFFVFYHPSLRGVAEFFQHVILERKYHMILRTCRALS